MKGLKGGFHTPQQFSPGTRRSGAGLGTQGWGRTAPSSPPEGPQPAATPRPPLTVSVGDLGELDGGVQQHLAAALRPGFVPAGERRVGRPRSRGRAGRGAAGRCLQLEAVEEALAHVADGPLVLAVPRHLLQQFAHRLHQLVHRLEVRAAAVQDPCGHAALCLSRHKRRAAPPPPSGSVATPPRRGGAHPSRKRTPRRPAPGIRCGGCRNTTPWRWRSGARPQCCRTEPGPAAQAEEAAAAAARGGCRESGAMFAGRAGKCSPGGERVRSAGHGGALPRGALGTEGMEFRSSTTDLLFLLLFSFLQTCAGSRLTEKKELPSSFQGAARARAPQALHFPAAAKKHRGKNKT